MNRLCSRKYVALLFTFASGLLLALSAVAVPKGKSSSLTISMTSLPGGITGSSYSANTAATGGVLPYTWSASGFPPGLSMSSAGTISGIPATAGTQIVSLAVTDSAGASASASLSLTIISSSLPPTPSTTYGLLYFGNAGYGGDDTNVFQTALNYTASNGAALEVPAGSYNVAPLNIPSNSYVIADSNVTVTATPGYTTYEHLLNINASGVRNVTIVGRGISGTGATLATTSIFQMLKAEYTSGEFRHCMDIENASNVTISGIACNNSGGDGAYVRASTNVVIEDCIFNNNRRQGSSITGQVNHVYYLRDHFTDTNGTAPQSGIDIEPNGAGDFLLDINIHDSYTDGNAGDGLLISLQNLTSKSQPVAIYVLNHHSTGDQRYGYVGLNNDPSNAPGIILIRDSFSDQSGSYGAAGRFYAANGASLAFLNLTVTNPHVNGPDPSYGDSAAVACIRGGGGTVPIGNVHFGGVINGTNTGPANVTSTNGNTDRYFNFQDYSNVGINNVTFFPGTLNGATQVPPNGLVQGQGFNSVSCSGTCWGR